MEKKTLNNIVILIITIIIIILTRMIEALAWWSFVVPVLIFGTVFTYRKWVVPVFSLGFLAGFIVWFGGNLYFDLTGNGIMLSKMGHLLFIPKIGVMLISGIVGGLVTGLALYTGKTIVAYRNAPVNPLSI
ncbi:putative membrane protein [Pedobacter cryoconitis]|uniref:Putative membrane protein n=1 Tax=Pedobacter cryoconitis TaxID=188932 RepID=A0A7W8YR68_9SPHI|nr:hypothetical protein [Pedobacter cryoconitis]MBB5620270.1 putative membrane protein [Pedobacter cryoconitis]